MFFTLAFAGHEFGRKTVKQSPAHKMTLDLNSSAGSPSNNNNQTSDSGTSTNNNAATSLSSSSSSASNQMKMIGRDSDPESDQVCFLTLTSSSVE